MGKENFEIKKIKTWYTLIKTINEDFVDYPDYIFRGHAQSDWLLESNLDRALKKIKYKHKDVLVKHHYEKFKTEIRGRRGINPKELNENETWALGQHYGLYTPLLDWTESPFVALFFAFSQIHESETGNCALWALHRTSVKDIQEWYTKKKEDKTVEIISPALDENTRLVSQRGLFTKISQGNDIESWVVNAENQIYMTLVKYEFPQSIREKALRHLDLMNINYSSLFPDLFGSSKVTNIYLENTDIVIDNQAKPR